MPPERMSLTRKISQLFFDFGASPPWKPTDGSPFEGLDQPQPEEPATSVGEIREQTEAEDLTQVCQTLLHQLEMPGMARVVRVYWNPRMSSTAGYASYPSWRIELNPRLRELEGQTDRTLRHELAHLVAYHRAGRRRIEPHGAEWRQACADLGIPGESARHTLPLPRRQMRRNYVYACAHCGTIVHRVRKFQRGTACRKCCDAHNGGQFDAKYRFVLIEKAKD